MNKAGRTRFDEDWSFAKGDFAEAQAASYDNSSWRRVDLPHDWSIEDLPPLPPDTRPILPVTTGVWRFKPGDDPAWKQPALDDSAWQEVKLPATWEAHSNYTEDNVYGWFRRTLTIPPEMRGKDILLALGKIDDVDETFVNGVKIGGMGTFPPQFVTAWEQFRVYPVPAKLLKGDGTDVVAVRVFDGMGSGGIYEAGSTVPHMRSGPFDSHAEGGGSAGFTLGGVGWYRKEFMLPEEWRGRRVWLTFDGVYMNCQVWCNGKRVAEHPYGYTSFHVDLTEHARFGTAGNVLAVRVDASGRTSRWYPGSGIYRHVWLTVTDPVHVEPWGVFVSTPRVTTEEATVRVQTSVRNDSGDMCEVTIESRVVAASGKTIASDTARQSIEPAKMRTFDQNVTVRKPALWSPDSPALYRLVSTLRASGKTIDTVETTFGIRTIEVDAEKGLRINGQPVKLRGGCVHHDNGCLGSCTYDRAEERLVELHKAAGFNAIRTAHNPPSPAFLDACDRLGMFVMDEAFDTWMLGKNSNDYGRFFKEWWQRDIESMVLRDRNHPSVIIWSIGNEIMGQHQPECLKTTKMLADHVRSLDPTRPVTQAFMPWGDWDVFFPAFDALDVCGYNYKPDRYVVDHEKRPRQVIVGTESFPQNCFDFWMLVVDLPYVIGDFVWTSYDYLGEAGIGRTRWDEEGPGEWKDPWPWNVAYCGDFDLTGHRRPASHYREAVWGVRPVVSCFIKRPEAATGWAPWGWPDEQASWNWPGQESKPLTVTVYSSCPHVKLALNGKDLGTKENNRGTKFKNEWELPYEPGELVAIGLAVDGKEAARWTLKTSAKPAAVRLTPDRPTIHADGLDLCFVTVEIVDADGVMNPKADNLVRFTLDGPGKIVAVSSGNPASLESFQEPQRKAFRGRCQVVIKADTSTGQIRLGAKADGLKDTETVIKVSR